MREIKVEKIISNFMHCGECDLPEYFTQFNIYKNLPLPCKDIKTVNIEASNADLEVNLTKIVNTMEGVSLEGQHLTGKKLVILGKVNCKLILRCPKYDNKLCSLEETLPFSTFIIIPREICKDQPINLRYHIEDLTVATLVETKVFISVTILLQYIDEY